jgi:effector-binding domain-containing protein
MISAASSGLDGMASFEERAALPYAGVRRTVTMDGLADTIDREVPALFGRLAADGVQPAGPPFVRYLKVDMERGLDIELGVPVAGDARVRSGALPAGRYARLVHVGPYGGLPDAHQALQGWAQEQGFRWSERVETYVTDPAKEPDPSRWQTEVAFF